MKKAIGLMGLMILVVLGGCSSGNDKAVLQATDVPDGDRIVATTVALTEIMDALDIDLVGVPSSYKDLPKRYADAKEVGNPMSPDMETLLSLKPTEIYSVTTLKYDLQEMFEERGINMTYANLESIDAMHQEILRIGEKYDRMQQAEAIVAEFEEKVAKIEAAAEGKEKPTVLILLGIPGSYLVATEHSYIGDLVKRAGGVNVITGEDVEFLSSNTEYLQQANPDIILRAAHGMPEQVVEMFDKEFRTNDVWKHFNAVKNGRIYDLEEKLFGTTGNLAAAEALDELQKMLFPE
ncbi:heme ABC transporter substrate-binding protein IsdE [Sporosarcina highlanderae]|uniref:High-affinity heme uptake system protein IsdE n=1 Tax=Sporosarcina highlanderae TaxID=3035916 RepID=A0ABT8JSS5_9BACL|nr:heme ABC transporter substrate-binding protein IsdE [Sporosarcina highlanderae]MDN4608052.1 heme ABC transporter substrate-binding protein IsdE [Sporosarcina highlanderae]